MAIKKNVVQMPPRPSAAVGKMSDRKWSREVMEVRNFCIFPSLLLHAQARLKITPTQLALLLHVVDFWWDAARKPWPSKGLLASRIGLSPRHVQRLMADLEEMGYVQRRERWSPLKGKLSNEYDLSGLVTRLKELAIEFKEADEQAKKKRLAVARPGLRKRVPAVGDDD